MIKRRTKTPIREPSDDGATIIRIPLTRGKFAIIERDDWEYIKRVGSPNAFADRSHFGRVYAAVWTGRRNEMIARILLKAKRGQRVRYSNGDTLDLRRANLSLVGGSVQ